MMLYILMLFSDFVPSPSKRSEIGITYMVVVCLFAAFHIIILVFEVCISVKWTVWKFFAKRK